MADLRMKDEPAPYYIDYEIDDISSMRAIARLGGIVDDLVGPLADAARARCASATTRSTARGSSRRIAAAGAGAEHDDRRSTTTTTPCAGRSGWRPTPPTSAPSACSRGRRRRFRTARPRTRSPDFSRETPVADRAAVVGAGRPRIANGSIAPGSSRRCSRAAPTSSRPRSGCPRRTARSFYREQRRIQGRHARFNGVPARSPPTRRPSDGMTVRDVFAAVESRFEDLPPMAELLKRARASWRARVTARRAAPVGEEFTGPAADRRRRPAPSCCARRSCRSCWRAGRRTPRTRGSRSGQGQVTPFLTRIGLRVLSDSFSVSDTPSLKEFDGQPVAGAYVVDDEGVPAKDVTLVEKGRLVTLLTSRTPQKNLLQSNGHGRSGSVQAGVFQVRSTQASPGGRAEGEVSGAAEGAGQAVRLHRAGHRRSGRRRRRRPGRPGHPRSREGDARRQGRAGSRPPLRQRRPRRRSGTSSRRREERVLHNYRVDAGTAASIIVPNLIFEELELQQDARDRAETAGRAPAGAVSERINAEIAETNSSAFFAISAFDFRVLGAGSLCVHDDAVARTDTNPPPAARRFPVVAAVLRVSFSKMHGGTAILRRPLSC